MVGITMCILYICECKLYAIMHAHVSGYALVLKIIFFTIFTSIIGCAVGVKNN